MKKLILLISMFTFSVDVTYRSTHLVIMYWVIGAILSALIITFIFIILLRIGIKNKTKALTLSQNLLNESQKINKIGTYILDFKTNTWESSLILDEIFGIKGNTHTIEEWFSTIHEDDLEMMKNYFFNEVVGQKKSFNKEYRIVRKTDNKLIWVHGRGKLEIYKDEIINMFGSIQDISERKEFEERNLDLKSELNQIRKMDAINKFSGSIAHDFNNIITVINGFTELSLLNPENIEDNLLEIKESCIRAEKLTNTLLTFSSKGVIHTEIVDLNVFLHKFELMIRGLIDEDINFIIDINHVGDIKADLSQLDQVLLNLISNAKDAINAKSDIKEKEITISTCNVEINGDVRSHQVGLSIGEYVVIKVNDNGIGMNKEIADKIYEPFFTTKDVGRGTGLGLSTVYSILKQNKGGVYLYSEEGEGTEFKLYWPVVKEYIEVKKQKREILKVKGKETILCVEDEPSLQTLLKQYLSELGYDILIASNGEEALMIVADHEIDLIITDMIMPKMGGAELINKLRDFYPDIKVIFTSGYSPDKNIENNEKFIEKPYSLNKLAIKIRSVLDI